MGKFSVGDTVYFIEYWSHRCVKAIVSGYYDNDRCYKVNTICYCNRDGDDEEDFSGTCGSLFESTFSTATEAYAYRNRNSVQLKMSYKEKITDIPSLLRFALDYCLNGAFLLSNK